MNITLPSSPKSGISLSRGGKGALQLGGFINESLITDQRESDGDVNPN